MTDDRTPGHLLSSAVDADPARPLFTFYDDATGERTELSVATFANWVAKTANLLRDELATGPGASIAIHLPLHWQTLVWLQASWAVGAVACLDRGAVDVDVAVVEHGAVIEHGAGADPVTGQEGVGSAGEVVSLGLGPLGLPRPGRHPTYDRAVDYDRVVHGHGDRFLPAAAPDPLAPALRCAGQLTSGGALVSAATRSVARLGPDRLLVTSPLREVTDVVGALLVPLAGAGAVLVRNLDPGRLPDLVSDERIGAVLVGSSGEAPATAPGLARFVPEQADLIT